MSENIKYAGFGKRLVAYFVDGLIFLVTSFAIQSLFGGVAVLRFLNLKSLSDLGQLQEINYSAVRLLEYIFWYLYLVLMWVNFDGATFGKKLVGIKVVRIDGSKVNYLISFIRAFIGYIVSAFALGLGFLWIIWDKKKQGWHDKIAGTIVVESNSKSNKPLAAFLSLIFALIILGVFALLFNKARQLAVKEIKSRPVQTTLPNSRF